MIRDIQTLIAKYYILKLFRILQAIIICFRIFFFFLQQSYTRDNFKNTQLSVFQKARGRRTLTFTNSSMYTEPYKKPDECQEKEPHPRECLPQSCEEYLGGSVSEDSSPVNQCFGEPSQDTQTLPLYHHNNDRNQNYQCHHNQPYNQNGGHCHSPCNEDTMGVYQSPHHHQKQECQHFDDMGHYESPPECYVYFDDDQDDESDAEDDENNRNHSHSSLSYDEENFHVSDEDYYHSQHRNEQESHFTQHPSQNRSFYSISPYENHGNNRGNRHRRQICTPEELVEVLAVFEGQWATADVLGRQVGHSVEDVTETVTSRPDVFSTTLDKSSTVVELVPKVTLCSKYMSSEGCSFPSECKDLHLCKHFVLDKCPRGQECDKEHEWDTDHNIEILTDLCLDSIEGFALHYAFKQICHNSALPVICNIYNGRNVCKFKDKCLRIHICKAYVLGFGECRLVKCSLNHDVWNKQCTRVLNRHGISTNQTPRDILTKLRHILDIQDRDVSETSLPEVQF